MCLPFGIFFLPLCQCSLPAACIIARFPVHPCSQQLSSMWGSPPPHILWAHVYIIFVYMYQNLETQMYFYRIRHTSLVCSVCKQSVCVCAHSYFGCETFIFPRYLCGWLSPYYSCVNFSRASWRAWLLLCQPSWEGLGKAAELEFCCC